MKINYKYHIKMLIFLVVPCMVIESIKATESILMDGFQTIHKITENEMVFYKIFWRNKNGIYHVKK